MKRLNRNVKGFTIVEMITVMAIIGVLLGVLAPTMSTYYWKSRVKSANADAKMIYNAVQTEVQRYIAYDRVHTNASGLKNTMLISYTNQSRGNFRYSTTADAAPLKSGVQVAVSGTHANSTEDAAAAIVNGVTRAVANSETKCWAVYINNYIVKASIAADNETTSYVGYYSTGKIGVPDDRPSTPYYTAAGTCWLTGSGADNSLTGVANKYDTTT